MGTVLIVDDERLMRDLLQDLLTRHGHQVLTAESGPAALELFQAHRPRVTLLDLNMPGMDGLTVLKRLRAIDGHAAVVVLTGGGTEQLENQARQLGVTDFLKKGFSPEVILASLQRLLQTPAQLLPTSVRSAHPGAPASQSLLVVEDEANSRELIAQFLTKKGYRVRTAADGAQAFRAVQEEPPQLIVLDLYMPEMNGVEVLRRLRAQGFRGNIIVLTGSQDEDLLRQALELGSVDVLNKPVEVERLGLAIDIGLALTDSAPSEQAKPVPTQAQPVSRGAEQPVTVLLVEDEAQLARLVSDTLTAQGYDVVVARDGDAAFRIFRERGESIDILLTDVMLPHINGLDLTTLVQGQWPHTKIILCSGQLSSAELANTGMAFLPKPFTADDLLETLGTLLPRPSPRQGQVIRPQEPHANVDSGQRTGTGERPGAPRPTQSQMPQPSATRASGNKQPSVLVIDDDVDISTVLREFLRRQGYSVRFAATGGEALVLLQKAAPDLLIMDLSMPGLNGVDTLRRLRSAHPNGLPYGVIVMTGSMGDKLFDEAKALGGLEILPKPLDPMLLEAAIKVQLERRRGGT
jgi:DNA-binding response OmpR family regulator